MSPIFSWIRVVYADIQKVVLSNKVFLAYAVNGKPLPQKHGFPLRVVAEEHYGFNWIKYVHKITIE